MGSYLGGIRGQEGEDEGKHHYSRSWLLLLLTGLAGNQSSVTRAFLLGSSNLSMCPALKRNTIHLVLFCLIILLFLLCQIELVLNDLSPCF